MDPMSVFVIEILRFGFGLGYFINFTEEFILSTMILIKEDILFQYSIFFNV